jgi:uncharacterized membrane protein YphA (DoxX/SURF4 family)
VQPFLSFLLEFHSPIEPMAALTLLIRLFTGILFFFQGYDKVFRLGTASVAETLRAPMSERKIPLGLVRLFAALTSWAELIGGALLLIGLFRFPATLLLGADLLIASAGFSLLKPVWDTQHVFVRLITVSILLMLLPLEQDLFCLDALFPVRP